MIAQTAKRLSVTAIVAALPVLGAPTPPAPAQAVSLAQEPVVMRLSKDEFRIAFGINAEHCVSRVQGCNGIIRYRVDWKTEDGTTRSETKQVSYTVAPQSRRSLAVDRQYFDTAEGAHTTDVVKISVNRITCADSNGAGIFRTAALTSP